MVNGFYSTRHNLYFLLCVWVKNNVLLNMALSIALAQEHASDNGYGPIVMDN